MRTAENHPTSLLKLLDSDLNVNPDAWNSGSLFNKLNEAADAQAHLGIARLSSI